MLDRLRTSLHRALRTTAGDALLPVRVPKDLARRLNVALGEPICSEDELARRRAAAALLHALGRGGASPATADAGGAPSPRVAAPVMVYVDGDRNARLFGRIKEMLDAKGVAYTVLDVAGDLNTRNFVMREAKVKDDDLPVVFVASTPVGGYNELVDWDVSGRFEKALYGALGQAPGA
jgi:hypothetical protein